MPMSTATDQTLGSWLANWLDAYAPLRCESRKTIEAYRTLARHVEEPATEAMRQAAETRLSELNHAQLEEAICSLAFAPARRRERLSARTIRHLAGLLGVSLQKAAHLGLIESNPVRLVELPRVGRREAPCLTDEQIQRLRDASRCDATPWVYPLIELALATGCRRGELLALEWSDVNWEEKSVRVCRSVEETKAGLRVKCPKSGRSRCFRLPVAAIVALRIHQLQVPPVPAIFWDGERQNYLRPALVSQVIVRRFRRAGVPGSLHTLRHTHASILLANGAPLPAVSVRLGHADPNITARIYAHAMPADDQRLADLWDEVAARRGATSFR